MAEVLEGRLSISGNSEDARFVTMDVAKFTGANGSAILPIAVIPAMVAAISQGCAPAARPNVDSHSCETYCSDIVTVMVAAARPASVVIR